LTSAKKSTPWPPAPDARQRPALPAPAQEARIRSVAVILLDVVLGYGAHLDPAAELGSTIREARALARAAGRNLIVIASVTAPIKTRRCAVRRWRG